MRDTNIDLYQAKWLLCVTFSYIMWKFKDYQLCHDATIMKQFVACYHGNYPEHSI